MNMKTDRLFLIVVVVIGIGTILSGCTQPVERPTIDYRVPVEATKVEFGTVENVVRATGNLRPRSSVSVNAEVPGRLYVERGNDGERLTEGYRVQQGDVIARVSGERTRLHLGLEAARLTYENAKRERDRKRELYARKAITEAELSQEEQNYETALLNYEQKLLDEKNVEIVTPLTGIILQLARDEKDVAVGDGQLIGNGFLVAQIAELDVLEAYVDLLGSDLQKIEIGQPVRVKYYGIEDLDITGFLKRIDPVVDEQTRTFQAVIEIPNPDQVLKPGMFIEVEIITELQEEVLVVKHDSIAIRGEQEVVYVIEGQKARERVVRLGLADDEKRVVIEGLEQGETIAIGALDSLYDNTSINVIGTL